MSNNFKSIEKKLTSNGWQLVRISGSHHQYKKAGVSTLATIPNHGKKDIPIGILKSLENYLFGDSPVCFYAILTAIFIS